MVVPFVYTEEEYKELEEERDFFKEQAILWRNDYKNEYEENKTLKEEQGRLHRLCSKDTKHIAELEEEIGKIREVNRENCSLLDEFSEKIRELEKENKKLKAKLSKREQGGYRYFGNDGEQDIYEEVKPTQKSRTITVTDEDNRIILEKGEDGKRYRYGGGNVVLC